MKAKAEFWLKVKRNKRNRNTERSEEKRNNFKKNFILSILRLLSDKLYSFSLKKFKVRKTFKKPPISPTKKPMTVKRG